MNGLQHEQDALKPAPSSSSSAAAAAAARHQQHQQLSPSASASRRHHGQHAEGHHNAPAPPAFDIKQHPAAIAYAASHPNRTIPKFGPYILLQTLGEGEFGKVKLGLHSHWAEEVAVKLIRRGSVENDVRMQKIRREIAVLESLHHPNIVRLYETIETDKYIGIILDYASGGELFDHILAHRYLRERDARKLFAQLISAVWYIHQKKIVHRDLKLENLLLDRNRNIIVTDFGFANRFEHNTDELMQTSCGSPCYAAPELVISEGMYVGSAVDVWSCGVILYAMLAGYLPFDDDPENPEGDNIQQLYRYILNTPLTFPDHVSPEARDLLQKMLVPEPTNRSTLQGIMEHPWFKPYDSLFTHSIEESERASKEQQEAKKHQYRKLMREREKEARRAQAQRREHHQTHHIEPSSASSRDAGGPSSAGMAGAPGGYPAHYQQDKPGRRAVASAIVMPSSPPEDDHPLGLSTADDPHHYDPFAPPVSATGSGVGAMQHQQMVASPVDATARDRKSSTRSTKKEKGRQQTPTEVTSPVGAAVNGSGTTSGKSSKKPAAGFRHTIQLEYDDGGDAMVSPPTPPRPSSKSQRLAAERMEQDMASMNLGPGTPLEVDQTASYFNQSESAKQSPTKSRRSSNAQRPSVPIPAVPAIPPSSFSPNGRRNSNASPVLHRNPATDPGPVYGHGQQEVSEASSTVSSPPAEKEASNSQGMQNKPSQEKPSRPASTTGRRHTRGISIDRIVGFGKLITGNNKETNGSGAEQSASSPTVNKRASGTTKRSSSRTGRKGADSGIAVSASTGESPMDSTTSVGTPSGSGMEGDSITMASSVTPTTPSGSAHVDFSQSESNSGSVKASKKRANKALSLMVDPISKIKEHRSKNRASVQVGTDDSGKEEKSERKTRGMSTPLSAQPEKGAPFRTQSETSSASNAASLPASEAGLHEKAASSNVPSSGWKLGLFRDSSVRGQPRPQLPPMPAQRPPVPVPAPVPFPTSALPDVDPYNTNAVGMAPSGATSKSQGVMDWFRRKSLAKERRRAGSTTEMPSTIPVHYPDVTEMEIEREAAFDRDAAGDRTKTPTPMDVQEEAKTPTRGSFRKGTEGKNTPSVIVTAAAEPFGSTQALHHDAGPSRIDRVVGAIKNVTHMPPAVMVPNPHGHHHTKRSTNASSGGSLGGSSSGDASHKKIVLRLHDGPVDPSTVSSAPPQEVMLQVLDVLNALGIQYAKESEFKYRCVRPKKKKPTVAREPSGSGGATTHTAAFGGLDKRGLPMPAPTFASTGNMFKKMMRRSSSHAPPPSSLGSTPPVAFDDDAIDLGTPAYEMPGGQDPSKPYIEPIYGDKPDQHDEVRFSVEITRLDRLDDLLSLDIRRLKGNLKSYKFLYDIIRERCNLQR